jgi:hypothetical protein
MAFQLSFEAEFYYPDKSEGITIPAILIAGDNLVRTYAKVDPGAEFCVFTHEVGRELGLDIESGIPKRMGSLTGTLDTFGHEVTLQTLEFALQSVVYFVKYPGLERNLLGRTGWLRQLSLAIVDYESKLYLARYS